MEALPLQILEARSNCLEPVEAPPLQFPEAQPSP